MGQRLNGGDGVEETTGDLLDVLLRNDEWKSTMGPATYAFHVTGVRIKERKPSSSELKFDLLNAPTCPPELVSLLSVTLSFSEWSNQSINNVTLNPGSLKYWCVQTSLARFQDYDIWYYKQPYKGEDCVHQVWLVLTREEERQYMEGLSNVRELKKGEENPFLYFKDGQPRITKDVKKGTIKYSVNLVVLKGFSFQSSEGKWEIVELNHALSRDDLASLISEYWSVYRKNSTVAGKGKDLWEILKEERILTKRFFEGIMKIEKAMWDFLRAKGYIKTELKRIKKEGDDLWDFSKKCEWRNRMVKAEYAYHVTSIRLEERKPTYTELRWHLATDYTYDRQLVGLPCVFFTTTTIPYRGVLHQSVFPRRGQNGKIYWRAQIPLNQFKDYDFWYCKYPFSYGRTTLQTYHVNIILTKGEDERRYVENIPDIVSFDISEPNPFLHYNKEKEQWYTNSYTHFRKKKSKINKNINYWTNFVVLKDFPLEGHTYTYVSRIRRHFATPLASHLSVTTVIKKMYVAIQRENSRQQAEASINQSANTQDEGDVDDLNKRMEKAKLSEENENGK